MRIRWATDRVHSTNRVFPTIFLTGLLSFLSLRMIFSNVHVWHPPSHLKFYSVVVIGA